MIFTFMQWDSFEYMHVPMMWHMLIKQGCEISTGEVTEGYLLLVGDT